MAQNTFCLPAFGILDEDGNVVEMKGGFNGKGSEQDWRMPRTNIDTAFRYNFTYDFNETELVLYVDEHDVFDILAELKDAKIPCHRDDQQLTIPTIHHRRILKMFEKPKRKFEEY
jgi:hypothetical protein